MKHRHPSASRQKTGEWGQNKVTNRTPYDPYGSQIEGVTNAYLTEIEGSGGVYVHAYPPASGLIQPLDVDCVNSFLNLVPEEFWIGLNAIFIMPGSKKTTKQSRDVFGTYWPHYRSIYLFPFSDGMAYYFKKKPKPSYSREYERHGAIWSRSGKGWRLDFTPEVLRSFYLQGVLLHEIGHHVENMCLEDKTRSKSESFANWFAEEFSLHRDKPSEFGQVLQELIVEQNEY